MFVENFGGKLFDKAEKDIFVFEFGIDRKFFDAACEQFCNIQKTVGTQAIEGEGGYTQDDAQLEPSFFCEALGLQGRIDLLQGNRLIELKSGKADEFHSPILKRWRGE